MKIAATADVHLGMKFSGYPGLQTSLAEARFTALERVVSAANERDADALVVAGDLFHRIRVAAADIERAAAILGRFTGAAVLVLPGNHDYLAPEGDRLWASFAAAAGDSTLVLGKPGPVDLTHYDLPLTVLAAPCHAQHSRSHRLDWLDDPAVREELADGGNTLLGVAHGSLDGLTLDSEGHYFPMIRSQLGKLPGTVWVVGHTHRYFWDQADGVVVPGTPEPDGFDVTTPGTAALLDLSDPAAPAVTSIDIGTFRFARLDVGLGELSSETPDELAAAVLDRIDGEHSIVRVYATGRLDPDAWRNWNAARQAILADDRVVQLEDHQVERVLTIEQVESEYDAGGFAHALLRELVANDDHEAVSIALDIIGETGG